MWWEVWTRPGSNPFQKIVADVPFNASSYHEGLGQVGDGTLSIPEDFDTTLLADPSIPSGSLLRLMSESGRLGEWLLTQTTPTATSDDPTTEAQGVGINSLLAYARLEPYDWDGSADFTSTFPDWVWGGRNVLSNPGFEDNFDVPTRYELVIDATAGNYTLSDGTNTTANIAFNANAVTVETRIETDLAFTDVLVSGSGTEADPFVIEYVTPPFGITLTINTGGLTGTATLAETQAGGFDPSPWTLAQTVSRGISDIFGEGTMEVSTAQAHTGTNSLLLTADPGPQVFGVQQVVRVQPDGIYQAGIWVYPTSAGSRFRFVIRTIYEGLIASGPWVDTLTANTWNFVSIPDVIIPPGVTEVIVRFATLPDGDMAPFYVDDATFEEGLAPMSVGQIIRLIYEDATTDHAPRMVWEDQVTSTPYLTLNFSDTLDSHGNAWDRTDLRIRLPMRMNYSQVMAELSRQFGYEYEVRENGGVWEWNVYNPGTLGTDRSATVSLIAGTTETRRLTAVKLPAATDVMVEGAERVTARVDDAGLLAALGRIEGSSYQPDAEDVPAAAAESLARAEIVQESYQLTLVSPDIRPLEVYRPGDIVRVLDPPIDTPMRVVDILLALNANQEEWVVQLGSVVLGPEARLAQAVGSMLPASPIHRPDGAFERATPALGSQGISLLGGGGATPTLVVAASDALPSSKDRADFICTGANDAAMIQQAIDTITSALDGLGAQQGGRIVLTEGHYNITVPAGGEAIQVDNRIMLQGMGPSATVLDIQTNSGGTGVVLSLNAGAEVRDLQITKHSGTISSSTPLAVLMTGNDVVLENVMIRRVGGAVSDTTDTGNPFTGLAPAVRVNSSTNFRISNCEFDTLLGDALFVDAVTDGWITDNRFNTFEGYGIRAVSPATNLVIEGNVISASGADSAAAGIRLTSAHQHRVANNTITSYAGTGLVIQDCDQGQAVGNIIWQVGDYGVRVFDTSQDIELAGNIVSRSGWFTGVGTGIILEDSQRISITNINIREAVADGISIDNCAIVSVTGGVVEAFESGMAGIRGANDSIAVKVSDLHIIAETGIAGAFNQLQMSNCEVNVTDAGLVLAAAGLTLTGTNFYGVAPGVGIEVTAPGSLVDTPIIITGCAVVDFGGNGIDIDGHEDEGVVITGCHLEDIDGHGIILTDTSRAIVQGNTLVRCATNSTAGSTDCIHVAGDSDENMIQQNRITPNGFARYGVNISAATCDDNKVVGNALGDPSIYFSDAYNDAGTGTENTYPNDATYGDNFT